MKKRWQTVPAAARMTRVIAAAAITTLLAGAVHLLIPAQASELAAGEPIEAETKVTNSIETGVIDIALSQGYLDENGNRVEGSTARQIMPGRELSLIPTVANEGSDCYVRVRLTAVVYDEDGNVTELESPFDTSDLYGVADDWLIRGDYLYYTSVFAHGESMDVFEGLTVPQTVGNDYAGTTCEVTIVAEAVQSDFFAADFASENPWGDLATEACIREGYDYASLRVTQDVKISVTYTGGADNFVVVPDDFFAHFAAMLPGGSYTGTVAVKNIYTEDTQLFFKTGVIENDNDLLEQVQIEIVQVYDDGTEKVLYDGAYNSGSLQEYISLGSYGEGEGCDIRFAITVPEELDNTYTLTSGKIDWYFKAESTALPATETPAPTPSAAPVSAKQEAAADAASGSTGSLGSSNGGKTGDEANVLPYAAAALLSALALAAAALAAGKKR